MSEALIPKEALLRQLTSSGFKVIRLKPHSKSPAGGSGWQQKATSDLQTINSWKNSNYGVPAGTVLPHGHKLVIIDVDCKTGKNGRESFRVPRQDSPLPPTAYSITPTGGEHHYYTARALPSSSFVCNTTSGSCECVWNGGSVENMIAFLDEKPQNVLTRLANEVCRAKHLRIVGRRILLGPKPMAACPPFAL